MDESNNMTCNQVPEPKSIANLIDELLNVSYTSVSSKRNFSKLTNWQICIFTAGTLLLLVWLLGPNLIDLGISIMCFVILSSIAYILVIFACKLPGMCDNASKQPIQHHYHGSVTHVEGNLIQNHSHSVNNSDNRISNQSSSNKTNIATELNVSIIPKSSLSSSNSSSAPIKYLDPNYIDRPSCWNIGLGSPAPSGGLLDSIFTNKKCF